MLWAGLPTSLAGAGGGAVSGQAGRAEGRRRCGGLFWLLAFCS
jgi:hypothetical protein